MCRAAICTPLFIASAFSAAASAEVAARPNVLVVIVDDMCPELGCYGGQAVTPHMDRLAERGVLYADAHVQYPQCMPSRVSFLTGKRVPGFVGRAIASGFREEGEPTMPEWFREHGYRTLSIGKVYHHIDDNEDAWDFLEAGCDDNPFRLPGNRARHVEKMETPRRQRLVSDESRLRLPPHTEATDQPAEKYQDGEIATMAVEQLEALAGIEQPFFMAVGFHRPHLPWSAPQKYWDLYDRDALALPENIAFPENGISRSGLVDFLHYGDPAVVNTFTGRAMGFSETDGFPLLPEADWRKYIHGYIATISHVDNQFGRLVAALDTHGMTENTIIVLFGDHGFHLGEHTFWAKVTNYRESSHVPFLLAGPGIAPAVIDQPVEIIDIYPTLCRMLRKDLPEHLHGSILPLDPADQDMDAAAFAALRDSRSIMTSRYRLNYYPSPPEREGQADSEPLVELYDYEKDPGGLRNVAGDPEYREISEALIARLLAARGLFRE